MNNLSKLLLEAAELLTEGITESNTYKIAIKIFNSMSDIKYGCFDKNGKELDTKDIYYSYVQTPQNTLIHKKGMCLDQVELEKFLFNKEHIQYQTFYIEYIDEDGDRPSHVFLTFKDNKENYYWFENSWNSCKGIRKYKSLNDILNDVAIKHCGKKFIKSCKICEYKENLCEKGQKEIINLFSKKNNIY